MYLIIGHFGPQYSRLTNRSKLSCYFYTPFISGTGVPSYPPDKPYQGEKSFLKARLTRRTADMSRIQKIFLPATELAQTKNPAKAVHGILGHEIISAHTVDRPKTPRQNTRRTPTKHLQNTVAAVKSQNTVRTPETTIEQL